MTPEIAITDYQKSLAFYCDHLDFSIQYDRPEEGFAFLVYQGSGKPQELMIDQIGAGRDFDLGEMEKPYGRGVNFEFETLELDALLRRLEFANIPLFKPMETMRYRVGAGAVTQRQIWLRDPDGYLLRFAERVRD